MLSPGRFLIGMCLVLFAAVGSSVAGIPKIIHFQGVLEDDGGTPLEGSHSVTFAIYGVGSGGTALWSETLDVACEGGLFAATLGLTAAIDLSFSEQYWLGCQVSGDEEMTPRYRLSSVPYAIYTAIADSATVAATASVARGIDWDDIWDVPFGFSDGIDNTGADSAHTHDGRYYTKDELSAAGTINDVSNPVDWTKLKDVPAGFSDGVDNAGGSAGGGWIDDGLIVRLEDPNDNVGIGTSTPSTKLGVGGTLAIGDDGSGHDVNFYGASSGGRLFWCAEKMALRAGSTSGSEWDTSSVGTRSVAFGRNTTASGYNSFACGKSAVASGSESFASGCEANATSYGSVAMGNYVVASGSGSVAFGYGTAADGALSFGVGDQTTSSGHASVAAGELVTASTDNSVAVGQYLTANAENAVVLGLGISNSERLINDISQSLMVGFNSDIPTLFVGPSSAAGTFGNVGIGTSTPTVGLDVADTVKMLGFKMPTGAANGYVLTSDTNGVGTWEATSGMDNDWEISGSDIYKMGGYVGIGTTSPAVELDVRGRVNVGLDGNGSDVICYGDANGSRLHWDADHLSLRAGRDTDGTHWSNDSTGQYSVALGYDSKAIGSTAMALGIRPVARGDGSVALGYESGATEFASTAIGHQCVASGQYSLALGQESAASGSNSTALGYDNEASGQYSTAIGRGTTASGSNAHALGYQALASGDVSFAWGWDAEASGFGSFAIGNASEASGHNSMAIGFSSDAKGGYSYAIGKSVTADTSNCFAIGIGSVVVDLTNDIENSMMIGFDSNLPTLFVGPSSGYNTTGNVGIATSTPTRTLSVNGDAGGTSDWHNDSDARLKKNIQTIDDALEKVMALRGVNFEWRETENHPEGLQMGLVAQEVLEVVPEVVDQKGEYYSITTASLVALLIEGMKEQQRQIENYEGQMGALREELLLSQEQLSDLSDDMNDLRRRLGDTR
jgi:hypothetical protein